MELIANLIIMLIAIRQALAAGGFNDSCSEVRYWDPDSIYGRKNQASPYIVARCMDSGKKERCSWLPLTVCFSNDDGVFGYRKNGNFAKTCHDCHYDKKTTDFFCLCPEKPEGQFSFPRVLLSMCYFTFHLSYLFKTEYADV
ncbi:hypothetical protein CGMCC3_g9994 [Colletotrichum fructicola]|nr:uncharacterized protein CGMCC3_g9994 [Colletotrichum fructicola]KAE9574058.1 hypothetical protein CGMCC3_g9994 [Colletotrichum fructicola]